MRRSQPPLKKKIGSPIRSIYKTAISRARLAAGLTQAEASAVIRSRVGYGCVRLLVDWESGERTPPPAVLESLIGLRPPV